jgi:hypothetical protein
MSRFVAGRATAAGRRSVCVSKSSTRLGGCATHDRTHQWHLSHRTWCRASKPILRTAARRFRESLIRLAARSIRLPTWLKLLFFPPRPTEPILLGGSPRVCSSALPSATDGRVRGSAARLRGIHSRHSRNRPCRKQEGAILPAAECGALAGPTNTAWWNRPSNPGGPLAFLGTWKLLTLTQCFQLPLERQRMLCSSPRPRSGTISFLIGAEFLPQGHPYGCPRSIELAAPWCGKFPLPSNGTSGSEKRTRAMEA